MKWSLNLGRVAGIRLSVHWTFIILIAWILFVYYRAGGTTEHGQEAKVTQIMNKEFLTLTPEMDLNDVYQKIMTSSCNIASVMENGELTGMVDKENINELIMVNQALKNSPASHF